MTSRSLANKSKLSVQLWQFSVESHEYPETRLKLSFGANRMVACAEKKTKKHFGMLVRNKKYQNVYWVDIIQLLPMCEDNMICYNNNKDLFLFDLLFYSTVVCVVPCGGLKSLPVHYHIADYILFPLGSLSPSRLFWKSNTDSPIFVILYVLCFQRQSFLMFILLYFSWCCTVWRP